MAAQDWRKSSIPKPSGIPKPIKGSLDQSQTPELSRSSSIPIKRKPTTPEPLKSPLRSFLADVDDYNRQKEDQCNISPVATPAAARSRQYGSKSLRKADDGFQGKIPRISSPLNGPNRQQQPSKIATRDVTVRAKEYVNREPSTPEQHHLNTPVSLGNLRESAIKDRSKVALRQTKSALPVLQNPCADIVGPKGYLPMSGVETDAKSNAIYPSTPSSDHSPEDVRYPQENVKNDAETPCSEITSLIYAFEHFTFFCLLDPNSPEKPMACASQFPWSSTQLQEKLEQFYLSALRQEGKVCEIIADIDSEGHEKSYLALVENFPTVATDNRDYSLACVVDVTSFINAVVVEEPMHEPQVVNEATVKNDHFKSEERPLAPVLSSFKDRLTTALLNDGEARHRVSVARRERRSLRLQHYLAKNTQDHASDDLVGRTVDEFTERFLEFYNDCFMLALSSSDDESYEITHVSDNIYKRKEYVDGHLTHSPREVFMQVRKALGRDERFTIRVQWGHDPTEKRLYCVPLVDSETQGWICLLVDSNVPFLWHTSYRGYFG